MREAGRITAMGFWTLLFVVSGLLLSAGPRRTPETDIVVTIESIVPENGACFSPVCVGFHDGSFDLFDVVSLASLAVERIAEDANFVKGNVDFKTVTCTNGGMHYVITSPAGFEGVLVFKPGKSVTTRFALTPLQHRYMTFAGMVVPSKDAFIGNHDPKAIEIFDAAGTFKGRLIVTILGSMVSDAGTELNNEMDAGFINQTAPNAGVTTMSPILPRPDITGSCGNPDGDPIILGHLNAAVRVSDTAGADFTLPDAVGVRITIDLVPAEQT